MDQVVQREALAPRPAEVVPDLEERALQQEGLAPRPTVEVLLPAAVVVLPAEQVRGLELALAQELALARVLALAQELALARVLFLKYKDWRSQYPNS